MGDQFRDKASSVWNQGTVGTTAGATLTINAIAGDSLVLEGIQGSSDVAGLVTVTYTKSGTSTTWKKRFSAAYTFSEAFPPGCIIGDLNTAITVAISASTANCEVNAQGTVSL